VVRNLALILTLLAAGALLACGGDSESAPVDATASAESDAPDAPLTPREAAAKDPSKKPNPKLASGDVLAQTVKLDAGDLHIVFTNNVDGEIEPCG